MIEYICSKEDCKISKGVKCRVTMSNFTFPYKVSRCLAVNNHWVPWHTVEPQDTIEQNGHIAQHQQVDIGNDQPC